MTVLANRFVHDMPFGAAVLANGTTRFRLWAPDAAKAWVEFDNGDTVRMSTEPDGWYAAVAPIGASAGYRYRIVDGEGVTLSVPDPAARAQWQDLAGSSIVIDAARYYWRHPEWRGRPWHETVLYELHVGALGGFNGVRARLPELARLGITAVELMPVAEFPGARNWGYDGVLPFSPTCLGSCRAKIQIQARRDVPPGEAGSGRLGGSSFRRWCHHHLATENS